MDVASIQLNVRTITGKKVNTLRRKGIVPVHVYGTDKTPQSLQVEAQTLLRLLPQVGTNVPVNIGVEGEREETLCFIREVQLHAVTDEILHVDFMRVDPSLRMQHEIPIVVEGSAPAARQMGGTLVQPLHSLLVECLPMETPRSIPLDVSGLEEFDQSIYVRDLPVDSSLTILTPEDEMVCRVLAPRLIEEEEEVAEEDAEAVEGEEDAEAPEGEEGAEEAPSGREQTWGREQTRGRR